MESNIIQAGTIPCARSTRKHEMVVTEKELIALCPQMRPYAHIFYTDPATVKDLVNDFLPSKLWRMNNLYRVQTKSTDEDVNDTDLVVKFVMKFPQLILYMQLVRHPRVVVLKSRQIGISTVTVLMYLDDMIIIPHLKVGILAQNQEAANGLKSKIGFGFDELDPDIKAFFGIKGVMDNDSSFGLNNGSTVVARLSFRSGTLHRLAWTEVGKIANNDPKRITETLSGSMQAIAPTSSNWVVNESTAEGNNYFKHLYDGAVSVSGKPITNKEVRALFFSWLSDKTCNSNSTVEITDEVNVIIAEIEEEYTEYIASPEYRNQLGNFVFPDGYQYKITASQKAWMVGALKELDYDLELFYREYPHTPASAFYVSNDSLWYKSAMARMRKEKRIVHTPTNARCSGLYNPDYQVFAVTDIGLKDRFFILYVQIIDTGLTTSSGLEIWDIRVLGEDYGTDLKTDSYADMMYSQPFDIDLVCVPHDGARGTVLKDSVSVEMDFIELGFDTHAMHRPTKLLPYILQARRRLGTTRIDATHAPEVLDNLENYKKKKDKSTGVYTSEPVHDIHSHGADAYRYVASMDFPCSKKLKRRRFTATVDSNNFSSSSYGTVSI